MNTELIQLVSKNTSVSTNGKSLFLHSWSSNPEDRAAQGLLVLLKTEAKKALDISTFSIPISHVTIFNKYQSSVSLGPPVAINVTEKASSQLKLKSLSPLFSLSCQPY